MKASWSHDPVLVDPLALLGTDSWEVGSAESLWEGLLADSGQLETQHIQEVLGIH